MIYLYFTSPAGEAERACVPWTSGASLHTHLKSHASLRFMLGKVAGTSHFISHRIKGPVRLSYVPSDGESLTLQSAR